MQRVTDEPSVSRGRTLRTRVSCRVLPLAVFYGCVVFFLSFKPLWLERLLGRHGIVSMRIPSVESCLMILKTFFFFPFLWLTKPQNTSWNSWRQPGQCRPRLTTITRSTTVLTMGLTLDVFLIACRYCRLPAAPLFGIECYVNAAVAKLVWSV